MSVFCHLVTLKPDGACPEGLQTQIKQDDAMKTKNDTAQSLHPSLKQSDFLVIIERRLSV